MPDATITFGRSADDILEGGMGGEVHRAMLLQDLTSALYGVAEEFRYDKEPEACEIVRLCDELHDRATLLSIDETTARLTSNRQCRRCSGAGETSGEAPCIECAGRGYVNAEEADG